MVFFKCCHPSVSHFGIWIIFLTYIEDFKILVKIKTDSQFISLGEYAILGLKFKKILFSFRFEHHIFTVIIDAKSI